VLLRNGGVVDADQWFLGATASPIDFREITSVAVTSVDVDAPGKTRTEYSGLTGREPELGAAVDAFRYGRCVALSPSKLSDCCQRRSDRKSDRKGHNVSRYKHPHAFRQRGRGLPRLFG
jgi:hypothetical protein